MNRVLKGPCLLEEPYSHKILSFKKISSYAYDIISKNLVGSDNYEGISGILIIKENESFKKYTEEINIEIKKR